MSTPLTSPSLQLMKDDIRHGQLKETSVDDQDLQKTSTEPEYPPLSKVLVIMFGIFLAIFLVALDRLIIGTAIPTITKDFNSLDDVGWYASSYLLTACAFVLIMGRFYTFYDPKYVFLVGVVIFEIGSAVSGAAPNSTALIIGRAIAGLGNAGIFQGAIVIVVNILPLHKRPMWTGFIGMVFGIASAVGPLLGGVFTDKVSWRWCFYINLPIGAVTIVLLQLFLKIPALPHSQAKTISQKFHNLDPFGTLVFLPSIVCLLLALQWGGVTYEWSNYRIIVLLVFFVVLLIAFIVIQYFKGANATVPGYIIWNRSILGGIWFTFFNGGSMMTTLYFVPIWFQAIKSASAVKSGIMLLPMVLSLVTASIIAGIFTRKVGYYVPCMIASSILMPIGMGLISTFSPATGHSKWIGYQVVYGVGLGLGMQQPSVAAQTVLARKDVATGASLVFFFQTLGGALFASVGNNLFNSKLGSDLARIPGIDTAQILKVGATELSSVVPPQFLEQVTQVYNTALVHSFYLSLAVSCLTVFGTAAMEWKSVKEGQKGRKPAKTGHVVQENEKSKIATGEESTVPPKEEV